MKNITITEKAKDKISERLKGDFLRLSLSGGGCNGYQYNWDLAEMPLDNDYVIDNRMVVDDHSMGFLWGSIIDWKDTVVEIPYYDHQQPFYYQSHNHYLVASLLNPNYIGSHYTHHQIMKGVKNLP
jgi:iron-sulfur cluster insertion protein